MTNGRDEDGRIADVIAAVTPEQWRRLAALGEQLLDEPGSAGIWKGGELLDDGSRTIGFFEAGEALSELVSQLYEAGLVTGVFDWPRWWSTCPYHDGEHVDVAPEADLVRLITSVVRGDRFSEGALEDYISNGALPTAVVRLAAARGGAAPAT